METVSRFRTVWIVIIIAVLAGCRHRRSGTDTSPYRRGCFSVKWGANASALDTLVHTDSSWVKISSVLNSKTNGKIVVARRKDRDYYFEFNDRDRFYSMNYISERSDLDSVSAMIQRYYGEPDRLERGNKNFENRTWQVEGDSVNLEIQLLITRGDYSLKVSNSGLK